MVASNRSIFRVDAVVAAKTVVGTVKESGLSAHTLHVVKYNGSSTCPIASKAEGLSICTKRKKGAWSRVKS